MVHKGKTKCTEGDQLEWNYLEHKTALFMLERLCSLYICTHLKRVVFAVICFCF